MSLEVTKDPILFAKELSSVEFRDTSSLSAAVRIMNRHLLTNGGNVLTMLQVKKAYLDVPYMYHAVDYVPQDSIEKAQLKDKVIQGLVDSIRWVGSDDLTSFGLHVNEVVIIEEPEPRNLLSLDDEMTPITTPFTTESHSAFVPIEAIEAYSRPFGPLVTYEFFRSTNGKPHGLITPVKLSLQTLDED